MWGQLYIIWKKTFLIILLGLIKFEKDKYFWSYFCTIYCQGSKLSDIVKNLCWSKCKVPAENVAEEILIGRKGSEM